jgi:hypothetical protein
LRKKKIKKKEGPSQTIGTFSSPSENISLLSSTAIGGMVYPAFAG